MRREGKSYARAIALISKMAEESGKQPFVMENWPSGYWIDFVPAVQRILCTKGTEEAKKYILKVFEQGHCRDAYKFKRPSVIYRCMERVAQCFGIVLFEDGWSEK